MLILLATKVCSCEPIFKCFYRPQDFPIGANFFWRFWGCKLPF